MPFDPQMDLIKQSMNNFFASGMPIVALVVGIALAAFAIRALVRIFIERNRV